MIVSERGREKGCDGRVSFKYIVCVDYIVVIRSIVRSVMITMMGKCYKGLVLLLLAVVFVLLFLLLLLSTIITTTASITTMSTTPTDFFFMSSEGYDELYTLFFYLSTRKQSKTGKKGEKRYYDHSARYKKEMKKEAKEIDQGR